MLWLKHFASKVILYRIMSLKHRKINVILRRKLNYNINQTVLLYSGGLRQYSSQNKWDIVKVTTHGALFNIILRLEVL